MWLTFFLGLVLSCIFYWLSCPFIWKINKIHDNHPAEFLKNGNALKSSTLVPPNVEVPQPPSGSLLNVYQKAAICSDKVTCSNIGSVIFQHEGNVIDAAIATLLCNGLITMQSMGLGGGIIINYYNRKEKRALSIIGREKAPLNIEPKRLQALNNATLFSRSALSIAVPGELAAYHEAHIRFGSLPWSELVHPSLQLCYQGYQLTRHQYDALFLNEKMIRKNKLLAQMFVNSTTNSFHKVGVHIKFPSEVCATYKLLSEEGPSTFYNGSLASLIISDLNEIGCPITLKDLHAYRAEIQDSLMVDLEPYYVFLPQPPGSGHVLGFIMKILHFFKKDFSLVKDLSSLEVHRIVEALKFGFVKRWEYDADISYKTLQNLFKEESVENFTHLIDDLRTFDDPRYYGSSVKLKATPDYGTAHISVLAPNGDAVSATSSINYYFGSGHMGLRSGVLFNNAMSDFTIENFENYFNLPNVENVNYPRAYKFPMSSMVPLIATGKENGDVRLVVGAAGGSRIISTLAQILVRVLWQNQNIKQAIDAPRFHHQLLPNIMEYEFGMLQQVVDDLEKRGHKTERERRRSTAVCGVEKLEKHIVLANADYRKEGGVDGF